jgi:hypothetical protein
MEKGLLIEPVFGNLGPGAAAFREEFPQVLRVGSIAWKSAAQADNCYWHRGTLC